MTITLMLLLLLLLGAAAFGPKIKLGRVIPIVCIIIGFGLSQIGTVVTIHGVIDRLQDIAATFRRNF